MVKHIQPSVEEYLRRAGASVAAGFQSMNQAIRSATSTHNLPAYRVREAVRKARKEA